MLGVRYYLSTPFVFNPCNSSLELVPLSSSHFTEQEAEEKKSRPSHSAEKWQSQKSNPGSLQPEPALALNLPTHPTKQRGSAIPGNKNPSITLHPRVLLVLFLLEANLRMTSTWIFHFNSDQKEVTSFYLL